MDRPDAWLSARRASAAGWRFAGWKPAAMQTDAAAHALPAWRELAPVRVLMAAATLLFSPR
ncbi:MAG: hypothetical protein OD918_09335 [Gammaproteobacteria bacterium]